MMMMPAAALPKPGDANYAGGAGAATYKRLWVHEVLRVFYDRLVDNKDRDWLLGQLRQTSKECLNERWEQLMGSLLSSATDEVGPEELRR
jgi:dynein heavy chain